MTAKKSAWRGNASEKKFGKKKQTAPHIKQKLKVRGSDMKERGPLVTPSKPASEEKAPGLTKKGRQATGGRGE